MTAGTVDELPKAELRLPEEAAVPERVPETVLDPETLVPLEG